MKYKIGDNFLILKFDLISIEKIDEKNNCYIDSDGDNFFDFELEEYIKIPVNLKTYDDIEEWCYNTFLKEKIQNLDFIKNKRFIILNEWYNECKRTGIVKPTPVVDILDFLEEWGNE